MLSEAGAALGWPEAGRAWIEAGERLRGEARPVEAAGDWPQLGTARPGPEALSVSGTALVTTLRDIVTRIVTFVTKVVTHCDTGQSRQHYLSNLLKMIGLNSPQKIKAKLVLLRSCFSVASVDTMMVS